MGRADASIRRLKLAVAGDQFEVEPAASERPGGVFLILSGLSAAIILALLIVVLAPAAGKPSRAASQPAAPHQGTAAPGRPAPATTIYLVPSASEAEELRRAFDEWDESIREDGLERELLIRVVIAEAPGDALLGRAFDFSYIRPDGGQQFRVIDLRY